MIVLREGSTISTEELWSDHRVLGHLPDQDPSPLIAQFGQADSSRKSLGGSKHLPFKNDGGLCVLGDLQCCRIFLVPFLRSVPRHAPSTVCAFPNHVQSIEFTTGGLQSSCRNITDDQWKQDE